MPELPMHSGSNAYPEHSCCVLWAPIPLLSHMLPFVGHTMITDSEGHLFDFAGYAGGGNSAVIKDLGIFGRLIKVLRFDDVPAAQWDQAVHRGNKSFEKTMHGAVVNNCHSRVCATLNGIAARPWHGWWNMVLLAASILLLGSWIPETRGRTRFSLFQVGSYVWFLAVLAIITIR